MLKELIADADLYHFIPESFKNLFIPRVCVIYLSYC